MQELTNLLSVLYVERSKGNDVDELIARTEEIILLGLEDYKNEIN